MTDEPDDVVAQLKIVSRRFEILDEIAREDPGFYRTIMKCFVAARVAGVWGKDDRRTD